MTDLPLFAYVSPPLAVGATDTHPCPSVSIRGSYPEAPGTKDPASADAAISGHDAHLLRTRCIQVLSQFGPLTPDEIAHELGSSVLAIRPRLSELRTMQRVRRTGQRRANQSGKPAHVLALQNWSHG